MNWSKRLPYWIIIILLIVFIRQCTGSEPCAPVEDSISAIKVEKDTMFLHDTIYVEGYVPDLKKTVDPEPSAAYQYTEQDTNSIVADYDKERIYRDSQNVENGYVIIKDTVAQNRIKGRSFTANINSKIIKETTTITVTQKEQSTNELYLGIAAYGNKNTPINAAGASLMLKTKRERIYEAGVFIDLKGIAWYYGGMKFKIKIK